MRLHPSLLVLFLFLLCLPARAGTLVVDVLDVGQGDAILLVSPEGKTALVDGGGRSSDVVGQLLARGVQELDLVVATHAHLDHIGGLLPVLEGMPVGRFMDSGRTKETAAYRDLMRAVEERGVPYLTAERGQRFALGEEAVLHVLFPLKRSIATEHSADNANAVILRLEHQGRCMLLASDAEPETEAALVGRGLEPCEVLKVAHHGGENSSTTRFLRALQPDIGIISVAAENRYEHPRPELLARLERREVRIYRTDRDGTVRVLLSEDGVAVETGIVPAVPGKAADPAPQPGPEASTEPSQGFVASQQREVFHDPGCQWAQRISTENLVRYATYEEAIAAGKRPAGCCKPEPETAD